MTSNCAKFEKNLASATIFKGITLIHSCFRGKCLSFITIFRDMAVVYNNYLMQI